MDMVKNSSMERLQLNRRECLRLGGLAAFSLGLLVSGCAVDPVTGSSEFVLMSEQEEIELDRNRSPYQFSADYGVVRDDRLNSYIDRVGRTLAANSHRPQMPFSYRGVNAVYINAYAFPGGSIAATRGILVELENEAELAALLGHETGHVCARHAAEQAGKGTLTRLLLAGATIAAGASGYGGAGDLIQGLGNLGAGALLAHYSRDNEREADALGMEYMVRSGYSPEGMVGLMKLLQKNGRKRPGAIELMFSTHPMSAERLQNAVQAANGKYGSYRDGAVNRERYMDHTARLRSIGKTITALQQGAEAQAAKNYRGAEALYRQALDRTPDDYAGLVMMAGLQLRMKRPEEAAGYSEQAAAVYPDEAQARLIGAAARLELSQYDRALEQLDAYDRLLPGNPEVVFFKGFSREQMGETREAALEYRKYLSRVRQGKQARYAYSRLKSWGYIR